MDWWDDVDLKLSPTTGEKRISSTSVDSNPPPTSDITARISCLPCRHTSARTAFDKGVTLWCSWAVSSGGKSVYFGGDTGYRAVPLLPKEVDDYGDDFKNLPICPAFKQIGDLRGPFDLGLIPIGAYDPRDIMSPVCRISSSQCHWTDFEIIDACKPFRCSKYSYRYKVQEIDGYTLGVRFIFSPPNSIMPPLTYSFLFITVPEATNSTLSTLTNCQMRKILTHWFSRTWTLTVEDVLEPPQLLKRAMKWKGLPMTGVFDVCDIGESREFV